MEKFIELIIKNLNSNGFPEKKVSLPTEKMYELADDRGLSLNSVLDQMKQNYEIDSHIEVERIIFTKIESFHKADMFTQAQEMLKNLSPEQISQYRQMFENMSDAEKEDLMKKGKDLGII